MSARTEQRFGEPPVLTRAWRLVTDAPAAAALKQADEGTAGWLDTPGSTRSVAWLGHRPSTPAVPRCSTR